MNDVLSEYLDSFVVVYLNDILIYSKNREEHIEHCKLVLDKLRFHGIIASLKKCQFFQTAIDFLGFPVTDKGIAPTDDKVKVILNYPKPKTEKEAISFIGLASFYRQFVK